MKRKYISPEDLAEVKKIDLFTYLSNYEPGELVKKSRNDYVTKTHSSLHIQNGLWMWWAHHIGGRSALDYLIKVEGYSFKDAAFHIHDLIKKSPPVIKKQFSARKMAYKFKLPDASINNDIMLDYLVNERKLDKEIVKDYIDRGFIYEDKKYHAVVFIGYNLFGEAKFASLRGTDSNWKKDVPGSNKQYSFSVTNKDSNVLHVFESCIDLISFQTILKIKNRSWNNENYLSLDGVSIKGKHIKNSSIPPGLEKFLSVNNQIKKIHLHLDNDRAGRDTAEKIKYHLENDYEINNFCCTGYKDINELLCSFFTKKKYMER